MDNIEYIPTSCINNYKNPWKINSDSTHLLDRNQYFFNHGNIMNVKEWTKNMTAAITRGNQKTKDVASDLHKFFKSSKPVPRPKKHIDI